MSGVGRRGSVRPNLDSLKRYRVGPVLWAFAALFVLSPQVSAAPLDSRELKFCNHTPNPARVALGFEESQGKKVLEGWIRIWPGECVTRNAATAPTSSTFTYGEAGSVRWDDPAGPQGCIQDSDFRTTIGSGCIDSGSPVGLREQPAGYNGSILRDPQWPALSLEEARVLGVKVVLRRQGNASVELSGNADAAYRSELAKRGVVEGASGDAFWRTFYPNSSRSPPTQTSGVVPEMPKREQVSTESVEKRVKHCNATLHDLRIAYGYLAQATPERWESTGWYEVIPGACATEVVRTYPGSSIYTYAEGPGLEQNVKRNPLASDFCISAVSPFKLQAGDKTCGGGDGRAAWFVPLDVTLSRTWQRPEVGTAWSLEMAGIAARQQALTQLKLYSGPIDGKQTEELKNAIALFGKARKVSGEAALWSALVDATNRRENYAYLLAPAADGASAPPPSSPVPVASKCPASAIAYPTFTNGYKYPYPATGIVSNFWDEFAKAKEFAHIASIAAAFRQCLANGEREVKGSAYYILNGAGKTSALIPEPSRLLMLQSLSHLYPPNRSDQDPVRAAALVRQAFTEYKAAIEGAQQKLYARYAELQQKYEEEKRLEEERYRRDSRNTMIGAIIGGILLSEYADAPPDVVSKTVSNMFENTRRYHATNMKYIERNGDRAGLLLRQIETFEEPKTWTDDGVRLHVVRFGVPDVAHGPAQSHLDHTRYLVRVRNKSGSCTGAMVGPRLVLTAQHCIVDELNASMGPTEVRWEYFAADRERGMSEQAIVANAVRWTTASGHWKTSWANDWAFIELDKPLGEGFGYLSLQRPGKEPQRSLIALGGYSSDIDRGDFITMDWGCPVKAQRPSGVVEHACKSWKGASGSPIVVSEGADKGKIIGVHAFGRSVGERFGGGPSTALFYETWRQLLGH